MSLIIPTALLKHTDNADLLLKKENARYGDTLTLRSSELTDDMVTAVRGAAETAGDRKVFRVADAILRSRAGDFSKTIPSLTAAPEIFLSYFRSVLTDGWLYKRGDDDHLHPWLVTDVKVVEPSSNGGHPYLSIGLIANGKHEGRGDNALGVVHSTISLTSERIIRKRVEDILAAEGVYIETPDLRAEYDTNFDAYATILAEGFSEQYRFTGKPFKSGWRNEGPRNHRKVIHDLHSSEIDAPSEYATSDLFAVEAGGETVRSAQKKKGLNVDDGDDNVGPVPIHTVLRVFDLHSHDFIWVNSNDLVRYEYDKTLADKIILPEDQRNLLTILTSDLDDFTGDVIEGKSSGNVVLCKGEPGVGKTLTAEVYSELIERPLYAIHSGNLGVSADDVRKNLEITFQRSKRWGTVLLLDEADVFVLERGDNIMQNAIVAEFLRTLEYFDGLMFMTTNRANNIDDAILSRAAAIIDYKVPDIDGIRAVWKVQANQHGATLDDNLLDALVHGFERITPRDVKMLLRLALRVAKGNGTPLDVETFARCAMFRGLHFKADSRPESLPADWAESTN